MGEYTNGDAVDIIEHEGMGYAIQNYCDGDSFKDPETRRLWNEAALAMNDLERHLRRETGRDF